MHQIYIAITNLLSFSFIQAVTLLISVMMLAISYCSDIRGRESLQTTVKDVLGNLAADTCSICILVDIISRLCAYLVAIGDQFEQSKLSKLLKTIFFTLGKNTDLSLITVTPRFRGGVISGPSWLRGLLRQLWLTDERVDPG